tara:strand:+ start:196 stop:390 length:195 start_codon:yes stop_codon:yes gene_type:complete
MSQIVKEITKEEFKFREKLAEDVVYKVQRSREFADFIVKYYIQGMSDNQVRDLRYDVDNNFPQF